MFNISIKGCFCDENIYRQLQNTLYTDKNMAWVQ